MGLTFDRALAILEAYRSLHQSHERELRLAALKYPSMVVPNQHRYRSRCNLLGGDQPSSETTPWANYPGHHYGIPNVMLSRLEVQQVMLLHVPAGRRSMYHVIHYSTS